LGADQIAEIAPAVREVLDAAAQGRELLATFQLGGNATRWVQFTGGALDFAYPSAEDPTSVRASGRDRRRARAGGGWSSQARHSSQLLAFSEQNRHEQPAQIDGGGQAGYLAWRFRSRAPRRSPSPSPRCTARPDMKKLAACQALASAYNSLERPP